jgi:hypothetical protein
MFSNNIRKNFIFNRKQHKNKFNLKKNNRKINDNYKKDSNSFELNQESTSHLSTASEGGEYYINNNNNNNPSSSQQNLLGKVEINNKNDEKTEIESIKKAFKDISNYFNCNQCNFIPFACYYYCDINMNEQREKNLYAQIQQLAKIYK